MRKSIVLLSLVSLVVAMSGCLQAERGTFAYSPRTYPFEPSVSPYNNLRGEK